MKPNLSASKVALAAIPRGTRAWSDLYMGLVQEMLRGMSECEMHTALMGILMEMLDGGEVTDSVFDALDNLPAEYIK